MISFRIALLAPNPRQPDQIAWPPDIPTTVVLIVQREKAYAWTEDEVALLRNAADRLEIAIARRRDEERQDVTNKEIAHRLKNSLAMTQAMASQTLRGDASAGGWRRSPRDYRRSARHTMR